jgi:carbon-monoxide dehydrogenase small subunit
MIQIRDISTIELDINGEKWKVTVRAADTLLHTLREQLGLTGAKAGCENGDCGACTVLVDGWPIKSCLMLAVEAVGHSVTTIEGLKNAPTQKAFFENWRFQCGYCTSGFIMNCHALATIHPGADDDTIADWLQSNICRCTSYEEIANAVKQVLKKDI